MSNIVQFLEDLGRGTKMPGSIYATAVEASGLDPQARKSLLARDVQAVSSLLDGRECMVFSLMPAENDAPLEEQEQESEERPEEETRDCLAQAI